MFPRPLSDAPPSAMSSLMSAYASVAASSMLVRSMAAEVVPQSVRSYIYSAVRSLFFPISQTTTIVIDEDAAMSHNEVYEAAMIYLSSKLNSSSTPAPRFHVSKTPRQKTLNIGLHDGQQVSDTFENIHLSWRLVSSSSSSEGGGGGGGGGPKPKAAGRAPHMERRFFELSFNRKFKDQVMESYLPYVLFRAKKILDEEKKVVRLYTRGGPMAGPGNWGHINLEHPSTFETLAMDPEAKRELIEDLERFLERKEFYKKVGKAWKRGYLLYGPPGTGKSSLIAAMANYLKFDIYDLELSSVFSNGELRRILMSTTNRSILVIEDIDCSVQRRDTEEDDGFGHFSPEPKKKKNIGFTLSGLLNFIDGLWSSCGDERIIVFTTNHKERLDPALLRPGRMDVHIHMSYCSPQSFKFLANNYLDLQNHALFGKIESLLAVAEATPAEVAEELMRSTKADVALRGVVNLLKRKRAGRRQEEIKGEEAEDHEGKRLKYGDGDENGTAHRSPQPAAVPSAGKQGMSAKRVAENGLQEEETTSKLQLDFKKN